MAHNAQSVGAFLAALESLDVRPIAELVSTDVVEVLPLNAPGGLEPAAVFDGRDAVLDVNTAIVDGFSEVRFRDPRMTTSDDGQTVFVESLGRRVRKVSGDVYENIYVLKFEFRDGLIHRITEYSNPVAFARFFDLPIG